MSITENSPFIRGDKITLMPINLNHINLYTRWACNPKVRKYSRNEIPHTIEDSIKFYNASENQERKRINFEIWHNNDEKSIGLCEIGDISWTNRNAYIGFLIGEIDYWGQGFGTEITQLLIEYGFKELNLNKITAEVIAPNIGSRRCLEKNNFRLEGSLIEDQYIYGIYLNVLLYGRLKRNWINSK
jgi:RimJ/RimL family protein N-acetyltransferase